MVPFQQHIRFVLYKDSFWGCLFFKSLFFYISNIFVCTRPMDPHCPLVPVVLFVCELINLWNIFVVKKIMQPVNFSDFTFIYDKPGSIHLFYICKCLHQEKNMTICWPVVSYVWDFDFAIKIGTYRFAFSWNFGIFAVLLFIASLNSNSINSCIKLNYIDNIVWTK